MIRTKFKQDSLGVQQINKLELNSLGAGINIKSDKLEAQKTDLRTPNNTIRWYYVIIKVKTFET